MTPTRIAISMLAVLLAVTSCRGSPGTEPAQASVASADADGMCKEHGVLEAVCTKCNPALIPVFKAKGDWCEEHGFPESFCPICHPERGGRPVENVGQDPSPPDGVRVRFKTKETARLAGIEVAKVEAKSSALQLSVTARIVYDATKVAEVNARSPGVVRAIRADVGTRVRAGSPLATIESATVGADQARLHAERSRVQVAEANFARVAQLQTEGITSQRNVLVARQELDAARAALLSVQSALGVVGTSDGGARYTMGAPIAGVVTRRSATIGRVVDTSEVLFEIVNTSAMWAEVDIPESELARVVVGRKVTITVDGLDNKAFEGSLDYVAPSVDPRTRTATGRVALANPDGLLRGNMFARAQLTVAGAGDRLVVPKDAVQRANSVQLVFVRVSQDAFEGRRVEVGSSDGADVEVRGRLQVGEEVATTGSFLLRTETLKGSIGAGCCDVEGQ